MSAFKRTQSQPKSVSSCFLVYPRIQNAGILTDTDVERLMDVTGPEAPLIEFAAKQLTFGLPASMSGIGPPI